jgi:16S rRNA (adenine(1408)-N(1))-methyltransferase
MKVLKGKNIEVIDDSTFKSNLKNYKNIVIDIGTGDGGFVYRNARKTANNFYIGLDASGDNMMSSAVKVNSKASKGGIRNAIYLLEDALKLPEDLKDTADRIFINLPWGSLRDAVVKGDTELLRGIKSIGKNGAALDIYVTYSSLYEVKEISERDLPELSVEYITGVLKYKYLTHGILLKNTNLLSNEDLKALETTWAKKLAFGRKRDIYHLEFKIKKEFWM